MYHSLSGLSIILKNSFFLLLSVIPDWLNVVLQRKSFDQHELCWFANLFSNFLILRPLFSKIFTKISIFCFYMFTETETNIYSQK